MITHTSERPVEPARVVVLGAGGFIGRAVMAMLARAGIRALGLRSADIDLAGDDAADRLVQLLEPDDAVVMLAAITPDKGGGVPAFMANLRMGAALARAIERVPPAHLVYLSSATVYRGGDQPATEATTPDPPELFGVMHLARERLLGSVARRPFAILRPTLIHGPMASLSPTARTQAYGPNLLLRLARNDGRIVLSGRGEERRDYIALADVVRLIELILARRTNGLLNLATGRSIALIDLARRIADLFAPPVPVETTPREVAAPHLTFDIAALTAAFPQFAFTPLIETLAEAHEAYDAAARGQA